MNKAMPLVVLVVLLLGAGYLAWQKFGAENAWVCEDGSWVKRGNPLSAQPAAPCAKENAEEPDQGPAKQPADDVSGLIKVDSPLSGAAVTSPLSISGQARGQWYFEASFPVKLLDSSGQELASGIATAQGDWMTDEFVPFTAQLAFSALSTTSAELVLMKDNPSGLPENDAELRLPLVLSRSGDMPLLVYFQSNKNDPQMLDCGKTAPAERLVPRDTAVGAAALEELLKGPTEAEAKQGFFTSINSGVKLNKLTVEDGTARADFDERLGYQVAGSCKVTAIRAQIEATLKQFPTVREVVISIDGRTEDVLQP